MKKKLVMALLTTVLMLSACGNQKNNESSGALSINAENNQGEESIPEEKAEDSKKQDSAKEDAEKDRIYEIGETWELEGQWALTIDSVKETDDRNEYSEKEPAAVYIIEYTYENLGYEDKNGIMDGLFFDLSMEQIVDADKNMGYSYPADQTLYATEVPVDAKTTAQAVIGVNNAGDFTLTIHKYDGNGKEQSAKFNCSVD